MQLQFFILTIFATLVVANPTPGKLELRGALLPQPCVPGEQICNDNGVIRCCIRSES
ncbi:hypothetical protein EIP91_012352 [Steccherinum ochraceum]|uniref:Hydrophobin n=1 Tax=Steccherinum ochraceum TaxID=92696 RepID=A0A4R0RGU2_9APHY|nr:hypothetical protein EIP91_012352 [Steccherinum ochraceum]